MLVGLDVDANPLLEEPAKDIEITILYEDASLLVINKPAGLLSVPGKGDVDSVFLRMRQRMPEAGGPLLVHRLDMATSGLLLIAKTREVHRLLQQQFIQRTVHKRYVALLEGVVVQETGMVDLPLRVDLDNRPQQLVCTVYGKAAQTRWVVVERLEKRTRVHLFPLTGRTHQLRIHAAHPLGLHAPIVGDRLYGWGGGRLCLHADRIAFSHPLSGERVCFRCDPDF